MSALEEQLHEVIHTNLCLLHNCGHRIKVEKGIFRECNLADFEMVGHALLRVIDPTECKKSIPWPLVNDKSLRSEFRTNFRKFIKMINTRYPEAAIPEITPSSLQFPVGLNFLRFMYKLSSFAMELELKRLMSPEEIKELLPRPVPSKHSKDQAVKLGIVRGAQYTVESSLEQYTDYQAAALPLLEKLNQHNNDLEASIKLVQTKLESKVTHLNVDGLTRQRLDIEDSDAMKDWNERTKVKQMELMVNYKKLIRYSKLGAQCCEKLKSVATSNAPALCLDGAKLDITPAVEELAGGAVYNSCGEVRLVGIAEAGQAVAHRLSPISPIQPSQLPRTQDLLSQSLTLQSRATQLTSRLHTLSTESSQIISQLRPVVYAGMREKQLPSHFKYLEETPLPHFLKPSSISNTTVLPLKQAKVSRMDHVVKSRTQSLERRGCKVLCSIKHRRSTTLYRTPSSGAFLRPQAFSSTVRANPISFTTYRIPHPATSFRKLRRPQEGNPVKADPFCRKSLYGKLPTGKKSQCVEDFSSIKNVLSESLPQTDSSFLTISEGTSLESELSNNVNVTSPATDFTEPTTIPEVTQLTPPLPKPMRKSFDRIVDRYKKLKRLMAENPQKPL